MKRIPLLSCAALALCGTLTIGCNTTPTQRVVYANSTPTQRVVYVNSNPASSNAMVLGAQQQQPAMASPVQQVSYRTAPVPVAQPVAQPVSVYGGVPMEYQPVVYQTAPVVQVVETHEVAVPVAVPAAEIEQASYKAAPSGFPRKESVPPRRSFVDITASSCYGHAEDYSWVRGEVEYSRLSKGWRIRYASVDEVDRYGGSLVLTGDLDSLKDGQRVEIKGHVQEGADLATGASFRVESVARVASAN